MCVHVCGYSYCIDTFFFNFNEELSTPLSVYSSINSLHGAAEFASM